MVIADVLDEIGVGFAFGSGGLGRTQGSRGCILRTPEGRVLLAGEASHTRCGREYGVRSGSSATARPTDLKNLLRLKRRTRRHPDMGVRLWHRYQTGGAAVGAGRRGGGRGGSAACCTRVAFRHSCATQARGSDDG